MPDELAGVCVAFDAMVFQQHNAIPQRFAEAVPPSGGAPPLRNI